MTSETHNMNHELETPVNFLELLDLTTQSLPETDLRKVLHDLAERDVILRYRLTVQLVPLSMDDIIELLNQVITSIRQDSQVVSPAEQRQIAQLAKILIERGMLNVGDKKPLEASRIGFAIFFAIEPLLAQVQDEGHTLQSLIADTFNFLASLVKIDAPSEDFMVMTVAAETFMNELDENRRSYIDDWKQIAALYRKRAMQRSYQVD